MKRAGAKTGNAAMGAVQGVGRWFGLVGDEREMEARRAQYAQAKREGQGMLMGNLGFGPSGPSSGVERRGFGGNARAQMANRRILDSSSSSDSEEELPQDGTYSRDISEAMEHYRQLRKDELARHVKPGWFGGKVHKRDSKLGEEFQEVKQKHHKRRRSEVRRDTFVQAQLQAMPTFKPYFTYGITFVQVVLFALMMAEAYTSGEFDTLDIVGGTQECSRASNASCPTNFFGNKSFGLTKITPPNYLIGPSEKYLISMGAKYTYCMRPDTWVQTQAAKVRRQECGGNLINSCEEGDLKADLIGCCVVQNIKQGMTTEADCNFQAPHSWKAELCKGQSIDLRPCCLASADNSCQLMTSAECEFVNGKSQSDQVLCSNVTCLVETCTVKELGLTISADKTLKNQPAEANAWQWYRIITPLFLFAGGVQFLVIIIIQVVTMVPVERHAGFLRVAIIYFICGIGGYFVSGLFVPGDVAVGPDPAVYGFLGVHFVELFQAWQIIPKPWISLLKLFSVTIVLLMIGTLPYIDNWSQ